MKSLSRVAALGCAVLLGAVFTSRATADEWNKKTVVSFNNPVEIPGRVLPAGTYVFKLLDSTSDRNIVQIFNKDENHLYATILAVPDYRLEPKGKTVITFEERAKGAPEAVRAWFYPGDLYGQEFVYPKARAMELAKANNEHVLSMPAETAKSVTQPAESGTAAMKRAPIKAAQPSGQEVEVAQVHPPSANQPPAQATAPAPPARRMPQTASQWPLALLAGWGLLGAALALRKITQPT